MPRKMMIMTTTPADTAATDAEEFMRRSRELVEEIRTARKQLSIVAARYSAVSNKVVDITTADEEEDGT